MSRLWRQRSALHSNCATEREQIEVMAQEKLREVRGNATLSGRKYAAALASPILMRARKAEPEISESKQASTYP